MGQETGSWNNAVLKKKSSGCIESYEQIMQTNRPIRMKENLKKKKKQLERVTFNRNVSFKYLISHSFWVFVRFLLYTHIDGNGRIII
jgi:hypothetical protein